MSPQYVTKTESVISLIQLLFKVGIKRSTKRLRYSDVTEFINRVDAK